MAATEETKDRKIMTMFIIKKLLSLIVNKSTTSILTKSVNTLNARAVRTAISPPYETVEIKGIEKDKKQFASSLFLFFSFINPVPYKYIDNETPKISMIPALIKISL